VRFVNKKPNESEKEIKKPAKKDSKKCNKTPQCVRAYVVNERLDLEQKERKGETEKKRGNS